jgi:hypothetical protein
MIRWCIVRLLLFHGLMFCSGCGSGTLSPNESPRPAAAEGSSSQDPLIDVAAQVGPHFTYANGEESGLSAILESLGGGLGWLDYDRDGWLDLVVSGGGKYSTDRITGKPSGMFRNLEARKFQAVGAACRIDASNLYTHGVAIADYDADGFADILITGYGAPQLWKNLGDGTFFEVAFQAALTNSLWSSSAGWADFNGDGLLDLYLAHYVNWSFDNNPLCLQGERREICSPREFEPLPDTLYYNQGDGAFQDVSQSAGLREDGKGLGVLLCDIEPDGDMDIYVANDTTDNFLYVNDGAGKFEEVGLSRGVALDDKGIPNGSMGVDICDFNFDGRPDLWVTNYEREAFALYRNEGSGHFLHLSQRLGVTDLGGLFVGFGTACGDFDSDGDADVIVANGHVIKYSLASPRRQTPLLLQFEEKRFRRATFPPGSYFTKALEGRGLAVADYDQDGDLDVAISHLNEPLALLNNQFRQEPRHLDLELIGTSSNRDAVGARVELQLGERRYVRQVIGGGSYLSHSSCIVHFALPGELPIRELVIHWPSGEVQKLANPELLAGRHTLIEPLSGQATEATAMRSAR